LSPDEIKRRVIRQAPLLAEKQSIEEALRVLIDSDLPALPVVDDRARISGIFGEREFISALMPGYVGQLRHAAFVPASVDELIEKRQECRFETVARHMNTDDIAAGPDASDVQLAETFLHHRVLIVPVVDGGRVIGVVTRADFFRELAAKFVTDP
jgi:CBS-domain-containing membrane protein